MDSEHVPDALQEIRRCLVLVGSRADPAGTMSRLTDLVEDWIDGIYIADGSKEFMRELCRVFATEGGARHDAALRAVECFDQLRWNVR